MQATTTTILRSAWRLLLGAAMLLLAGCASLIPQTVDLRTDWPAGVPRQVELAQVPFFPQEDYQCGPAALAMAMDYGGARLTPEALVDEVWLPARHGSLQLEMLAAPRRHGLASYRLAPRYADLLREVAAGHPVIVLQDVGMLLPEWHYAVVNGFDYGTGTIFLRSGLNVRQEMPFSYFERTWLAGGYWAMVVTRPDDIPATATERAWARTRPWAVTRATVAAVDTAITPSAQPSACSGRGETRWRTASSPTRAAEANTSPACSRLAKASALPWP